MSYNGWTNYETWNVNLWIDNDEGMYSTVRDRAREIVRSEDDKDDAATELANYIENLHEEIKPQVEGTFADLLSAALAEVNWREIAEHHVDDLWGDEHPEEDEEEEEPIDESQEEA